MDRLKRGDRVRLKVDLSISESVVYLRAGDKGYILHINDQGYTVVFDAYVNPVATLSDREIELDTNP